MNKKFFSFLVITALFAAVLTSCNDKEEPEPGVKVENETALTQTVFANETSGKSGVTFVTTGAWTSSVTEGTVKSTKAGTATWVSINPKSGNAAGSHTIAINLEPNETGADRAATITILSNNTNVDISVTQKAITVAGDTLKPAIAVTGVALNDSVARLTPGSTHKLEATVFPATATNKNIIWSTNNASVATVTAGVVTAGNVAGTAWITATTQDGGYTDRCRIVVSSVEKYINQEGGNNQFSFPADPGEEFAHDVYISSNVESWTVSIEQTGGWLRSNHMSGSNNGGFSLFASANTGTAERTATVTVSGGGAPSLVITVTQAGAAAAEKSLNLSTNLVEFLPLGTEEKSVGVTSNTTWTTSVPAADNWLKVSRNASGNGNGSFYLMADRNTGVARSTTVTVSGANVPSQTITVKQAAVDPPYIKAWDATQYAFSFPANPDEAYDVMIYSNIELWNIAIQQTGGWLQADKTSGSLIGNIRFTAVTNTGAARTATVTVSGEGAPPLTITITQNDK